MIWDCEKETENMDVAFAFAVIFTGIVIVFLVLVLLIAIMMIMGKLLYKPQQPTAPSKPAAPASPHRMAVEAAKSAPAPIVESGIEEETVAVISAAIAALTGGAGRIASIRKAAGRSHGKRRAWASAGLRENTQPF